MIERAVQRFEGHPAGRAALSAVIVVLIVALVSANLPPSPVSEEVSDVIRPVRDGLGLDGSWGVFAPAPRRTTIDVGARLEYADGSTRSWRTPSGDDLLDPYRSYHWQKWMEQVYSDGFDFLWPHLATWLARTQTVGGEAPVTVVLIRRWRENPPPGSDEPPGEWQEYEYFTYQVPEEGSA